MKIERLKKRIKGKKRLEAAWNQIEKDGYPYFAISGVYGSVLSVAMNGWDRASKDLNPKAQRVLKNAVRLYKACGYYSDYKFISAAFDMSRLEQVHF